MTNINKYLEGLNYAALNIGTNASSVSLLIRGSSRQVEVMHNVHGYHIKAYTDGRNGHVIGRDYKHNGYVNNDKEVIAILQNIIAIWNGVRE